MTVEGFVVEIVVSRGSFCSKIPTLAYHRERLSTEGKNLVP
jgi:hypothetical protein